MAVDYTTLTGDKSTAGSIKFWVNHDLVDADGALTQAQAWVYERLRVRQMRVTATVELDEGDFYVAFPEAVADDFLSPIEFKWRGDTDAIKYVHEALLDRFIDEGETAPDEGRPTRFATFNERFEFEVKANEDLIADVLYYRRPADLSDSNTTNFLTRRFPTLLREACEAFAHKDRRRYDQADACFKRALLLIDEANMAEDLSRQGQVLR